MNPLTSSIEEIKTNDGQWRAFQTQGNCIVIASPGSGKTKLLTTKAAHDLAHLIAAPQGAACITLTNAATQELRERLDALGVKRRANLFIGTVHGFALRCVLEPFAGLLGRKHLTALRIADSQQQRRAFEEATSRVYPTHEDTRNVRSTVDRLRQRLADESEWQRSGDRIIATSQAYLSILSDNGLIDFQELISTAVSVVEQSEEVRHVLSCQFPVLYVDEYQDLAPGLHRLVSTVCLGNNSTSRLFAVGDPDQALYEFTGTRPELLYELARHPSVSAVNLTYNYRCGAAILELANRMRAGGAPMIGRSTGGEVRATECTGGLSHQYRETVSAVKIADRKGTPLHEVGILCPTNAMCQEVSTALRSADIPALVRGTDYRLTPTTVLIESAAAWSSAGMEESGYRLSSLLSSWRRTLGPGFTRDKEVRFSELLFRAAQQPGIMSAQQFVEDLLSIGLQKALSHPSMAEELIEVKKMLAALATPATTALSVRNLGNRALRTGRVEVTTLTSSKGLEFDMVILLGMDEDHLPSYQANTTEKINEERRKFFVSITRARENLLILYSGFTVNKYNRVFRNGPSRFLREVGLI